MAIDGIHGRGQGPGPSRVVPAPSRETTPVSEEKQSLRPTHRSDAAATEPAREHEETVSVDTFSRAGTRLRVDEDSQRIVAQILDENHEVVKQVPPEETLELAARLKRLSGILFDKNV